MPNAPVNFPGLGATWVGEEMLVGPFPFATDINSLNLSLVAAPGSGNALTVGVFTATGGGGAGGTLTFNDLEVNADVTFSTPKPQVASGGYMFVRVIANTGNAFGLSGFIAYEPASGNPEDLAGEPLTLNEVKEHLRIKSTDVNHDNDLGNLIQRTREEAERLTGLYIKTTTVTEFLNKFPSGGELPWWDGVREGAISALEVGEIELPSGNLQSVTSVTTYDDSDVGTVFAAANYFVDTSRNRIVLRNGQSWPVPTRAANGVELIYVMGWPDPASVPGSLKELLKERISQRWVARKESRITGRTDAAGTGIEIDSSFYGIWVRKTIGERNLNTRN